MIRHVVFFEQLSKLEAESPEWQATYSGLLVLRLFDAWIEFGPHIVTTDLSGALAVRAQVERVDEGNPVRGVLINVLDHLQGCEVINLPKVAPQVLNYGQALDYAGKWELAADVFRSVVAHTHPEENAVLAIEANRHLGRVCRNLAQWDEAETAASRMRNIANHIGDVFNVLWSFLGDAKTLTARGNLPKAEQLLDETINQANIHNLRDIRTLAVHQRAVVAHHRGNLELAISLGYEALQEQKEPTAKDRVLEDLAAFFAEMGVLSAARDAHMVLAVTAQEQVTRWRSTLNLMEIAHWDNQEPIFEQYRQELEDVALPPELSAYYHLYVGHGYERFGHFEQAREAYHRAIALASANNLNQVLFEAEEALVSFGKKEKERKSADYVSTETSKIATAIGQMRELVK